MIAKASLKYIRISSRKVREVIPLVKGKGVLDAISILTFVNKKAKDHLIKLLKSAISSAKNKGLKEEQLYISKITANEGPAYKRFRAAAFGRAVPIRKRTSHIDLELELKNK